MKIQLFIILACITYMPKSLAYLDDAFQLHDRHNYEQELTKVLSSLNKVTGVPSFSVAVVHKGKLIASVSTGYSDSKIRQLAKATTSYRLASVSKIIGATMLAELVVNGRLDPDAGIGTYFPEISTKYHNITIRQLLSHTSGMPHYQIKDFDIYDKHFDNAIDAAQTLKERDLLSRPGTKYHYSTHGYTLAGAIYEKITKESLPQGVDNFVTRWTGKATPAVENINALTNSTSKLYELTEDGVKEISHGEKSYSVFGAGLYATASDLAYFGGQVLAKAKSNKRYQEILFTPTVTKDGSLVTNRQFKVGFGWRIATDSHGRTVYHHAGATPGARSILAVFPEQDLSIALLSNSSWVSSIDKLVFALAGLYIDKANVAVVSKANYQIHHNDVKLKGVSNCQINECILKDATTNYSRWLNTFNRSETPIKHWPILIYNTVKGQRLLMVNKVGVTVLEGKDNNFEVNTNKGQTYSVHLTSQKQK